MNNKLLFGIGAVIVVVILAMVLSGDQPAAPMTDTQQETRHQETGASDEQPADGEAAPGYQTFAQLEGTWPGTWQNTTFGSEGDIAVTVAVAQNGAATMTLDIGGFVFGLADPDPMQLSGSYTADVMTFSGSSDLFGEFSAAVTSDGSIILSAPEASAPGIASLEVSGTIDQEAEALSGVYTVVFSTGGEAQGVISF